MIQRLQTENILEVVEFGQKFWDECGASHILGPYNKTHIQKTLLLGLNNGSVIGWINKVGFVNGVIIFQVSANFWSGHKTMSEIAWYADQSIRGSLIPLKLYLEAEKYAKQNAIEVITMARISGTDAYDKLPKFYKKRGFNVLEETFVKTL